MWKWLHYYCAFNKLFCSVVAAENEESKGDLTSHLQNINYVVRTPKNSH